MRLIFSKPEELALKTVLFLSVQPKNRILKAKEIADNIKAPKEFVAKVLQTLAKKGLIYSKKGRNGGFSFQLDTQDVNILEIIKAFDGLKKFEKCIFGFEKCSDKVPCPLHKDWLKIRVKLLDLLESKTLYDIRTITLKKIKSLK